MNRALLALAATLAMTPLANAQQTHAQLQTYNNANIKSNGQGQITGPIVNTLLGNMIASSCGLALASDCILPSGVAATNIGNIGSGHVFGNGTGVSAPGADTSLLAVMQQSGSGLGSGIGTAAANATNAANGFLVLNASGLAPVVRGGTGTATPNLVAGTNITISGTWPNQTINSTGGSGTPAGTNGQVQFNSAGAFGGFTVGGDGTLNTGSGSLIVTKTNGASFGGLATVTPGTGVATAAANSAGGVSGFALLNGSGLLPIAQGGSGAASPSLVAGTNVTITGTWPNQTVTASGGTAAPGGTAGQIQWNSAGALAGFTASGDATVNTTTGAVTVTKTSGSTFGALATLTPGTGVATALGINVGTAGSFITNGGALGTPSSGVGTNITGVNAATLGGATFASPGAIGGTTAGSGAFTTLSASTSITDTALSSTGMVTNTAGGLLGTVGYATASDIKTGTDATKPVTANALSTSAAIQSLTFGATINWNMQSGYNASVTLTASTGTLAAPTNIVAGQTYTLLVVQDGTGSRTVTWASAFNFGAAGTPTLTTTANKTDIVSCLSIATAGTAALGNLYCTVNKGF